MSRAQTMSKLYYDDEIRGVFPDGSIYLKDGVKRNPLLNNTKVEEEPDLHINYYVRQEDILRKMRDLDKDDWAEES